MLKQCKKFFLFSSKLSDITILFILFLVFNELIYQSKLTYKSFFLCVTSIIYHPTIHIFEKCLKVVNKRKLRKKRVKEN